jgi:hypothetical protein
MIVVSTIGLRLGGMPRWLAFAGYVLALALLLVPVHVEWIVLLFPAWVAAVSVLILRVGRSGPPVPQRG